MWSPTIIFAVAVASGGGLTREAFLDVIRGSQSAFEDCYRRELAANPNRSGTVEATFTIAPSGAAVDPAITRDTLGLSSVPPCIVKALARLRFPPSLGGRETPARFAFQFAPSRPFPIPPEPETDVRPGGTTTAASAGTASKPRTLPPRFLRIAVPQGDYCRVTPHPADLLDRAISTNLASIDLGLSDGGRLRIEIRRSSGANPYLETPVEAIRRPEGRSLRLRTAVAGSLTIRSQECGACVVLLAPELAWELAGNSREDQEAVIAGYPEDSEAWREQHKAQADERQAQLGVIKEKIADSVSHGGLGALAPLFDQETYSLATTKDDEDRLCAELLAGVDAIIEQQKGRKSTPGRWVTLNETLAGSDDGPTIEGGTPLALLATRGKEALVVIMASGKGVELADDVFTDPPDFKNICFFIGGFRWVEGKALTDLAKHRALQAAMGDGEDGGTGLASLLKMSLRTEAIADYHRRTDSPEEFLAASNHKKNLMFLCKVRKDVLRTVQLSDLLKYATGFCKGVEAEEAEAGVPWEITAKRCLEMLRSPRCP